MAIYGPVHKIQSVQRRFTWSGDSNDSFRSVLRIRIPFPIKRPPRAFWDRSRWRAPLNPPGPGNITSKTGGVGWGTARFARKWSCRKDLLGRHNQSDVWPDFKSWYCYGSRATHRIKHFRSTPVWVVLSPCLRDEREFEMITYDKERWSLQSLSSDLNSTTSRPNP